MTHDIGCRCGKTRLAAMWADPDVTRFIGGRPFTREESWGRFLRYFGMWQVMGFGFWVVTDKANGRRLGAAGFHELKRDLTPSLEGTMEAGWAFSSEAGGKGIATEAMTAAFNWADQNRPDRRVTCLIAPENLASLRVAEKLGFREFARTTYQGNEVLLMERDRRRRAPLPLASCETEKFEGRKMEG